MRKTELWAALTVLILAAAVPLWGLTPGDIVVADTIADALILIEPGVTEDGKARQTILYQGAPLARPRGVVLDAAGNILVADEVAGVVFKITGGKVAAKYGTAPLEKPYGITLDAAGKIYVTDAGTGKLVSIDPHSGVTELVCGNLLFEAPRGLAFSANYERLVVADYSALPRSRKGNVQTLGALVSVTLASCKTKPVELRNPNGVARDASDCDDSGYYVSLQSAGKIDLVDATGAVSIVSIVSQASQLQGPRGLALGPGGAILVADYVAGAVFEVDPKSHKVKRTFKGGWLKGPNDVAVVGPPPSRSTFAIEDDHYVWQITAADLASEGTLFRLAGLMNRMVYEAGPPQVPDLVLILTSNNDRWWFEIQRYAREGARIEGQPSNDVFEITSVSGLRQPVTSRDPELR